MTVSIASTNTLESEDISGAPVVGISPGRFEADEFEGGGGAGAPAVGISPAITVAERAQASAAANMSLFILFSFMLEDARTLAIIPDTFRE